MPHIYELQSRRPGRISQEDSELTQRLQNMDKLIQFNEQLRSENSAILATLNMAMPPASLEEKALTNNSITLTSGEHGGVTLDVADTQLKGMPAGVFMTRKVTFEADATVDGVHFITSEQNPEELAVVGGSAVVVFRNCTFEKSSTASSTFVTVQTDGKAIFLGCVFKGSPPSGDVIINGVAGNVQVVASYNKTGNALGTVTSASLGNL
jgi:hypothetical protein